MFLCPQHNIFMQKGAKGTDENKVTGYSIF